MIFQKIIYCILFLIPFASGICLFLFPEYMANKSWRYRDVEGGAPEIAITVNKIGGLIMAILSGIAIISTILS